MYCTDQGLARAHFAYHATCTLAALHAGYSEAEDFDPHVIDLELLSSGEREGACVRIYGTYFESIKQTRTPEGLILTRFGQNYSDPCTPLHPDTVVIWL